LRPVVSSVPLREERHMIQKEHSEEYSCGARGMIQRGHYRNAREMAIHTLLSLNGLTIDLAWAKSDRKAVPKRTVQPSFFVMITCGGHHDNVSPQRKGEREYSNKPSSRPLHCLFS